MSKQMLTRRLLSYPCIGGRSGDEAEHVDWKQHLPPGRRGLAKRGLIEDVVGNPLLAFLADDSRFKRIVKSLEEVAR